MVDSFFDKLPDYIKLVMGYASPLIVIAIIIAVFVAWQKTKNETNKAIASAKMLGLRYINVADEMKETNKNDSFLLGLLSAWSTWAMEGTYNNVPVRVELIVKAKQKRYIETSGRTNVSNPTRTSYSRGTTYDVSFEKPLSFDVFIHRKIEMPFGLSGAQPGDSIKTGDEILDQTVFISGNDKNSIQEWLNSNQRKDLLKKLFQSLPTLSINSTGLFYRDQYSKADFEHIKENLRLLTDAAQKLQLN